MDSGAQRAGAMTDWRTSKTRFYQGAPLHQLQFARIHRTLRVTPAMAAGLATQALSIEDIVGRLDRVVE
jgi:hypothetical protein